MGPLSFYVHTIELFEIISTNLPAVHCYAYDTHLYLAFWPDDRTTQDSAVAAMEARIRDVRTAMIKDKFRINDYNAEFTFLGTRAQLEKVEIDSLVIGVSIVPCSCEAIRNFGSWLDSNFAMSTQARYKNL